MGFLEPNISGTFSKQLMKKSGLIHYISPEGKAKILIEYDPSTGKGWINSFTETDEGMTDRLLRESKQTGRSED